jgi:hypothetical protein
MNNFYIYCHRRATDGTCFYIGKGKNNRYKTIQSRNPYWYNIVKKHGFIPEILINNITEEKAFELEAKFCKEIGYNNLCNIRKEKEIGWSHNDETKLKIGLSNSKPKPQTFGEKISKLKKGKKASEKTKQKMRENRLGFVFSEETKQKQRLTALSLIRSEKWKYEIKKVRESEEWKQKIRKPILQYNKQGNFIKEWSSIKEAASALNIDSGSITSCCKNRLNSSGGFKWEYKNKK